MKGRRRSGSILRAVSGYAMFFVMTASVAAVSVGVFYAVSSARGGGYGAAVATVFAGAHTVEELERSLAYESAGDAERDYAEAFASFPKISWRGRCMYCGHCAPCPAGIDIAMVNKLYDLASMHKDVPASLKEHYRNLSANGGDCASCGGCERRCPFGVHVMEKMANAEKLLG